MKYFIIMIVVFSNILNAQPFSFSDDYKHSLGDTNSKKIEYLINSILYKNIDMLNDYFFIFNTYPNTVSTNYYVYKDFIDHLTLELQKYGKVSYPQLHYFFNLPIRSKNNTCQYLLQKEYVLNKALKKILYLLNKKKNMNSILDIMQLQLNKYHQNIYYLYKCINAP